MIGGEKIIAGRRRRCDEGTDRYRPDPTTWIVCASNTSDLCEAPEKEAFTGKAKIYDINELRNLIWRSVQQHGVCQAKNIGVGAQASPQAIASAIKQLVRDGYIERVGYWLTEAPISEQRREELLQTPAYPADGSLLIRALEAVPRDRAVTVEDMVEQTREPEVVVRVQLRELEDRLCVVREVDGWRRVA